MNKAVFVVVALLLIDGPVHAQQQREKPNALFLCVDDMKDWVNCLGGYEGTVHNYPMALPLVTVRGTTKKEDTFREAPAQSKRNQTPRYTIERLTQPSYLALATTCF